jgi:hypothetical protein
MRRLPLALAAASLLLLIPAIASARPDARLAGTVKAKSPAAHLVGVKTRVGTSRSLKVPGSLARIHVEQRVELRGSVLRSAGKDAGRVLATGVTVVSGGTAPTGPSAPAAGGRDDDNDDEAQAKDDDDQAEASDDDNDDQAEASDDDNDDQAEGSDDKDDDNGPGHEDDHGNDDGGSDD